MAETNPTPRLKSHPLRLAVALCAWMAPAGLFAQTAYSILHTFKGNDGSNSFGSLVQGADGNLYGTTFGGGRYEGGTIFEITPTGTFKLLHSFRIDNSEGNAPATGLTLAPDGTFVGVTYGGGKFGSGTAFKMTAAGKVSTLHNFGAAPSEGTFPFMAALAVGTDGNYYGTTMLGGTGGLGTVFRLTPQGRLTTLHDFTGAPGDGANPTASLIQDSSGDFYGTTVSGGSGGNGTVFKMSADGTILWEFSFPNVDTCSPGAPEGALLIANSGLIYGTTSMGGCTVGVNSNQGTVFEISPDGQIANFLSFPGGVQGGLVPSGNLIQASDGNLYGTTVAGGRYYTAGMPGGTVYRVTPQDRIQIVHSFGATSSDGISPRAAVVQGGDGQLYGTTYSGGKAAVGVVFRLSLP